METEWVLRGAYDKSRSEIAQAFRTLLAYENVQLDRRALVLQVIEQYASGFDFADALHHAAAGDLKMKTFDGKFIKLSNRMGWNVSPV